ncbi:MAG: protein translocase subunit SecD [Mobilicoccus sp.]|nr:protein translocase subunit SecD [Mobilicoccus sp.]
MATTDSYTRPAWRMLAAMIALLLALVGGVAASVVYSDGEWTPKLGLDLEGGTQMILAPQIGEGQNVSDQQLDQAVDIMRARVDGQGVSEAEVATLGNNVVVAVPGEMTREQEDALRQSSQMRFRPVLAAMPTEQQPADPSAPIPTEEPNGEGTEPPAQGEPTEPATEESPAEEPATPAPTTTANAVAPQALRAESAPMNTPSPTDPATPGDAPTTTTPDILRQPQTEEVAPGLQRITAAGRQDPQLLIEYATSQAWLSSPEFAEEFMGLDCSNPPRHDPTTEDEDLPIVACDSEQPFKYLLGPAVLDGDQLADASSGPRTNQQGQPIPGYQVTLVTKPEAREAYRVFSGYMVGLEQPRNQLATVLDNRVVSAPYFRGPIPDGRASIDGNFDQDGAQLLADTLKFGALPISFAVQSSEQISPTVGGDQLRLGIIAGLIGLGLVIVYFLLQYRLLGLVTTFSLILVAAITYLLLTILGWQYNLRLTMAGVTGAIVAIGTTADSFIVYFERVRDEVREGRAVTSAVQTGWYRARRTILISGLVNFLAALVLYLLAASNVRGFAFMLMLTTVIDLVITFFFTFPMLLVLTRTKFFGEGHRWSGLSAESLGVDRSRYVGRGRVARAGERSDGTPVAGSALTEEVPAEPAGAKGDVR